MDIINGLFELSGGWFIALSCLRLYRDKQVRGLSRWHFGFFTAWCFWNLAYYPSLDQWVSFIGGLGVVGANSVYLAMMIYYSRKSRCAQPRINSDPFIPCGRCRSCDVSSRLDALGVTSGLLCETPIQQSSIQDWVDVQKGATG